MPTSPATSTPSDDEIVQAVRVIHAQNSTIGRAKLLVQLKADHNWALSDNRLKKILDQHALKRVAEKPKATATVQIPPNALAAQQAYKDDSNRYFKLYGRGEYDYGVTPNADMGMLIEICHDRLLEQGAPGPYNRTTAEAIAKSQELLMIFNFYWAAAQKVGLSKEDVGRQLQAEYGVDVLPHVPKLTRAQIAHQKAEFKKESMKAKRKMLENPEARKYIPVDAQGEPIWDEKKNGQFVVLVMKINKGDGLTEYGEVEGPKEMDAKEQIERLAKDAEKMLKLK